MIRVPEGGDTGRAHSVVIQYYGSDKDFRVTAARCSDPRVRTSIGEPEEPRGIQKQMKPPITALVRTRLWMAQGVEIPPEGLIVEYTTTDPDYPKLEVIITKDMRVFERLAKAPIANTVVGSEGTTKRVRP